MPSGPVVLTKCRTRPGNKRGHVILWVLLPRDADWVARQPWPWYPRGCTLTKAVVYLGTHSKCPRATASFPVLLFSGNMRYSTGPWPGFRRGVPFGKSTSGAFTSTTLVQRSLLRIRVWRHHPVSRCMGKCRASALRLSLAHHKGTQAPQLPFPYTTRPFTLVEKCATEG